MTDEEKKAIPIYEGQDFYVPTFKVRVSGRELPEDVVRDVTQVTYRDNIREMDSFEINIFNEWNQAQPDNSKNPAPRFKYSDQHQFDPGQKLELWMGYVGKDAPRLMLVGEITALKPSFPSSGQSMLVVSGLNILHRFRKKQESHAYENIKDSDIARRIAGRLDVDIDTPDRKESELEYVLQDNQYDIVFMMERAKRIGYDLFVKEQGQNGTADRPKLVFGPTESVRRTIYKLAYGKSLIDFQPNLTTHNQVSKVEVRAWDRQGKKLIVGKAQRSQLGTRGLRSQQDQAMIEQAFNQREEIIADRIVHNQAEANRLAHNHLDQVAKDMIRATGSTIGLPDLRSGCVAYVEGLGERFSGRYFVTSTTHTIGDGGYTTQFECRKEELN